MSNVTTIIQRDKDDPYFYHIKYYSDKGSFNHNACSYLSSFHYDNLWDIFGKEWAENLKNRLNPGDETIIKLTIEFKD